MARYRWGDGHYADVECAYAELERHFVLSCSNDLERKRAANSSGPKFLEETHRRGGRCSHSKAVKRRVRCDRRHRYGTRLLEGEVPWPSRGSALTATKRCHSSTSSRGISSLKW